VDATLFRQTIEPELARAKAGIRLKTGPIVAFGEMVSTLWARGDHQAAIQLEHLWSDFARGENFSLRCAYPIGSFAQSADAGLFREICDQHSEIIPAESYTSLGSEEAKLRMVSSLQQTASAVQTAVEERERAVAERKQIEEQLRTTEEFTRNIIEGSVDGVKVLDLEGRIQYMSPPGQRALEIEDEDQFLGRHWVSFWKEDDRPKAEAALAAARSGGVGYFQGDCPTMGGTNKSWDVRISSALGKDGGIERLVAVSRDISELRSAQEAAIQAEKLAAAGRLVATIAHQINNPLEAVTNFIYLAMTSEGLPEEVFQYLKIADRELARVAQIAQQTLGFYRDNSKSRWLGVADLVGDVMIIFERKLAYKHVQTEIAVDPQLKIFGKQGELRQALSNLIANAIDASKEGGTVWLRAHATRNWKNGMKPGVRITLADNGSGMTPEVQRRIFVPFFTTKTGIGTGIGLWAAKSLIEQQGGYMRFRSKQGDNAGTVMSLFLPDDRNVEATAEADAA
jgi:PAS domain S-box-containing protein